MKNLLLTLSILLMSIPAYADQDSTEYTLKEYFEYLPRKVHNNWIPYKSNRDYEVLVQFTVNRNGEITTPIIVKSTDERANNSALQAVKDSAPYKPLPQTYHANSVKTQVELRYIKQN